MRALAALWLVSSAACSNFVRTRPPAVQAHPREAAAPAGTLEAWWIGHATVLVRIDDKWFLMDPVFSRRVGIVEKRRVLPGVRLADLPAVDWVLVSHAHLDHLDQPSLERLPPTARLAVPPGVLTYLSPRLPFGEVASLGAWRSLEREGVRITAVPARHDDGRFLIDALWNRRAHTGWVIEYHGMTVYFAGDTGYQRDVFREIRRRFGPIDLALLPFGPAGRSRLVRYFLKSRHIDPPEAMRAFADLGARRLIPIHHGTFFRAGASERRAIRRAIETSPLRGRVFLLEPGQSVRLRRRSAASARGNEADAILAACAP